MTQEDKNLLVKDLCARLPYGVFMGNKEWNRKPYQLTCDEVQYLMMSDDYEDVPYLRPMSSMTEDEIYDLAAIMTQGLPHDIDAEQGYFKVTCKELIDGLDHDIEYDFYVRDVVDGIFGIKGYDWLNEHHFDYRDLISRGLAIEVTEENNPYKD